MKTTTTKLGILIASIFFFLLMLLAGCADQEGRYDHNIPASNIVITYNNISDTIYADMVYTYPTFLGGMKVIAYNDGECVYVLNAPKENISVVKELKKWK